VTATLSSGDLEVDVRPERGLDLAEARFAGRRISWESPLGFVPWQGGFARSFGGGLLVTCGLRNVGAPSEGQPQHGWYSSLAARDVELGGDRATGRVVDAEVPGPTLVLRRTITVAPHTVSITDRVRNEGEHPEPAPLLYHVNLLWDSVDVDSREVLPRDDDARAGDWRMLGPPGPERVYEHLGATRAVVEHEGTRITVRSDLPRLWQWIHPDYGVLAIEPANCSVLGRAHDRAEGRLPVLEPGEERASTLEIGVEAA
jgi:galactose mutarotase-like enzyme